jgi:hypothetical protein
VFDGIQSNTFRSVKTTSTAADAGNKVHHRTPDQSQSQKGGGEIIDRAIDILPVSAVR